MKSLNQLMLQLGGARAVGAPDAAVLRVHTDTRSLQPGDLFVALKGERFDAHHFLPQARAAGAVAAIAHSGLAAAGLPGVEVPDTRLALGELARLWREQFSLPLIAVTGSNGKTTVTQMVAAILRAAAGDAAHATQGNLNNDIGVPLTLLRLRETHRLAVIELGMNHPGEIPYLAALAQQPEEGSQPPLLRDYPPQTWDAPGQRGADEQRGGDAGGARGDLVVRLRRAVPPACVTGAGPLALASGTHAAHELPAAVHRHGGLAVRLGPGAGTPPRLCRDRRAGAGDLRCATRAEPLVAATLRPGAARAGVAEVDLLRHAATRG